MALAEVAAWLPELEPCPTSLRVDIRIRSPRDSEVPRVRCYRRRNERRIITTALAPYEPPNIVGRPPGTLVVTFTRHAMHPLDDDSLAYAFKSVRDAVAAWCGVKDGPKDPIAWRYAQERHVFKEPNPHYGRGHNHWARRQGPYRFESFIVVSFKRR